MLSRNEAVERANAHLRAQGSPLAARAAATTRNRRFAVWVVGYREAARPGEPLDGGGLVVTDDGDVHDLGSAPGSLDDLMVALGRWPGVASASVRAPASDTDSEALVLLADSDPKEAADLAAYREARKRSRSDSLESGMSD